MQAMQSLLTFLTKTNKVISEAKIEAWAENGKLKFSPGSEVRGYSVSYTANFEMTDVDVQPLRLFTAVSYWMNKYIPDRDSYGLPDPEFFAEPLQNNHFDLGVRIEFQEDISLVLDPNGDWLMDDGQKYSIKSDFGQPALGELLTIFDSHTQDNGLEN